jgi:hypothetical protein
VSPSSSSSPSVSPSASVSPSGSVSQSASISPSTGDGNQDAYPNSDLATGTWTKVNAATYYDCVNEVNVPDDTDYVRSPSTTGNLTVEIRQGTTLIATRTIVPSSVFETVVVTLTGGEVASVTDWTQLAVWLTVDTDTLKMGLSTIVGPLSAGPVVLYIRLRAQ